MRDFLLITIIFSIFNFFNANLIAQEGPTELPEEKVSEQVDPALPDDAESTKPDSNPIVDEQDPFADVDFGSEEFFEARGPRNINLETVNFNGVRKNTLTIVESNGEVSAELAWSGRIPPPHVQEALVKHRIDLQTLEDLEKGKKLKSTVILDREKQFAPEMKLLREEVRKYEDGTEQTIQVRSSEDGVKMEVTVLLKDDAEKNYRWEGDIPASIAEELGRLDPLLLDKLLPDDEQMGSFSLGIKLSHKVERTVENDEEVEKSILRVEEILPGGAAERSGLKQGDLLLAIDGVVMDGSQSIFELLAPRMAGDEVAITYQRRGRTLTTSLVLVSNN